MYFPNTKRKPKLIRMIEEVAKEEANYQSITSAMAPNAVVSSPVVNPVVEAAIIKSSQGKPLMTPVGDFRAPNAAAIFDILLVRDSADVAQYFPVPIFGILDRASDWANVLALFLPAGTTYTVARNADKKSIDIAYTIGGVSDVITISCNQVPYVNLLESFNDAVIKIMQTKLKVSAEAHEDQFARSFFIYDRSSFGKNMDDNLTLDNFEWDGQQNTRMRTINQIIDIDKERTLVVPMKNAAFTYSWNMFLQAFSKGLTAKNF